MCVLFVFNYFILVILTKLFVDKGRPSVYSKANAIKVMCPPPEVTLMQTTLEF